MGDYYAYGDQKYAPSPYGSGDYDGVQPRDVRLYYPDSDGTLNFNAPITYFPPAGFTQAQISNLTPIGEDFFSTIKIAPLKLFVSYHKVWIYNHNTVYTFRDAQIALDSATDPNGWIFLTNTVEAAPLPEDGNEINVSIGWGPGAFDSIPISLGDLLPEYGTSFWVKRAVTVQNKDTQYAAHSFIITGKTDVAGA